jgi:hypothetical protein
MNPVRPEPSGGRLAAGREGRHSRVRSYSGHASSARNSRSDADQEISAPAFFSGGRAPCRGISHRVRGRNIPRPPGLYAPSPCTGGTQARWGGLWSLRLEAAVPTRLGPGAGPVKLGRFTPQALAVRSVPGSPRGPCPPLKRGPPRFGAPSGRGIDPPIRSPAAFRPPKRRAVAASRLATSRLGPRRLTVCGSTFDTRDLPRLPIYHGCSPPLRLATICGGSLCSRSGITFV